MRMSPRLSTSRRYLRKAYCWYGVDETDRARVRRCNGSGWGAGARGDEQEAGRCSCRQSLIADYDIRAAGIERRQILSASYLNSSNRRSTSMNC